MATTRTGRHTGSGVATAEAPGPFRTELAPLVRLTDRYGVKEYLEVEGSSAPGYLTTDAARALLVVLHEDPDAPGVPALAGTCLSFLDRAVHHDGSTSDRLSATRRWSEPADRAEAWGRTTAAVGTAARMGATEAARQRATKVFLRTAQVRSTSVRAAALAAIGAVALVRQRTDAASHARGLLADCLEAIPRQATAGREYPDDGLSHHDAALCDALLVGGAALGRAATVRQGLSMLSVLMTIQTGALGLLSLSGGAGRGLDPDRQGVHRPAAVAAIADACAHAFAITGDLAWRRGVRSAGDWFLGLYDVGLPVHDPASGIAPNWLRLAPAEHTFGTETTLAALSTFQRVRDVGA